MKMIFTTKKVWAFVLLCALPVLLATNKAYGQSETGKFDFYLKANFGMLFNQNTNETRFEPVATSCLGAHLSARYNFSRLGISTGIGGDKFKFSQRFNFAFVPEESAYSTVEIGYLVLDIPLLVHFALTERFDIFGGVNIIGAAWQSYGSGTGSNGNSGMKAKADIDIPDWQFTQEVMAGLNYKLSNRFDLGLSVAKSLRNIDGMRVEMELSSPGQDDLHVSEKFDYSWTRFSLEVAYRLNK